MLAVCALAAQPALAKTLHGTVKGKDSTAQVVYHLKKKISADVTLHMTCAGYGLPSTTLDVPKLTTKPVKVHKGSAGGGFAINQVFKSVPTAYGPADVSLTLDGGTRNGNRKATTTFDATVANPIGSDGARFTCDLSTNFTAHT